MKLEFTPEEIQECVNNFGFDAFLTVSLHQWFGLEQLKIHKVVHNVNAGERDVSQLVFDFMAETVDDLELYATVVVTMRDGREITYQDLCNMVDDGENGLNYDSVAKFVEKAEIELNFIASDKDIKVEIVE
jgi:hypothetical protein